MVGAGAPPQLFQFLGLARQFALVFQFLAQLLSATMSKNVKPSKNQVNYYATIAQMEYAGLDTSSIVNNTMAAKQASRRKKIKTCGSDHYQRKHSVRDRLRKKLQAKLQAKKH